MYITLGWELSHVFPSILWGCFVIAMAWVVALAWGGSTGHWSDAAAVAVLILSSIPLVFHYTVE
jgi:ABC-type phosphate transport system permease subunit